MAITSDSCRTALAAGGFLCGRGLLHELWCAAVDCAELVGWTDEKSPSCYRIRWTESADLEKRQAEARQYVMAKQGSRPGAGT
jgi:hypothetical protein